MALININWNPSDRQLRQFAATLACGLPAAAWLLSKQSTVGNLLFRDSPWRWDDANATAVLAALAIGLACLVAGWLRPSWLRPLFRGLSLVTRPVGLVASEAILLLLYFVVFTPLGLLSRLLGRDPLTQRFDPHADSYWVPVASREEPSSYFKQF